MLFYLFACQVEAAPIIETRFFLSLDRVYKLSDFSSHSTQIIQLSNQHEGESNNILTNPRLTLILHYILFCSFSSSLPPCCLPHAWLLARAAPSMVAAMQLFQSFVLFQSFATFQWSIVYPLLTPLPFPLFQYIVPPTLQRHLLSVSDMSTILPTPMAAG